MTDREKRIELAERCEIENDALAWLSRCIEHAKAWLEKCEREVEAFQSAPELKPLLDRWQQDRDHTALMLGRYEALAAISADRDEWKQQHENLLGVREADLTALADARDKWVSIAQRTLAYLPRTLGIVKEIRRELPDVLPNPIADALRALRHTSKETNNVE